MYDIRSIDYFDCKDAQVMLHVKCGFYPLLCMIGSYIWKLKVQTDVHEQPRILGLQRFRGQKLLGRSVTL